MKKDETKIQDDFIRYLNSHKIWNFRYQAQSNKFGLPDIIAIYQGYFLGLEVKTPTGKPTTLQKMVLNDISDAGGYGAIVTSVEDVWRLLERIDGDILNEYEIARLSRANT